MSILHVNAEVEVSWTIFNGFAFRWRRRQGERGKAWAADDFMCEINFVWQLFTFPHRSSEVNAKLWHSNNIAKH